MEKKLIIVSNRLPIKIKKRGSRIELRQSSGGLVSAINAIPRENNIVWIGAADFKKELWEEYKRQGEKRDMEIIPVFLDKKTEGLYYNGFSNTIIWPLFHYFPSLAEYEESFFRAYKMVNQQFAEAVKAVATPQDTVWVHDYQLMLLPGYLRKGVQKVSSSFFLHIPFPSYELFKQMPEDWRTDILHSLLATDVCGFQIREHASHFKKALSYFLGLEALNGQVSLNNHTTSIGHYPISIDYDHFNSAFDLPEVKQARELIRQRYKGMKIIFSLDRLDYSKGVMNRLQAYEQILRDHPECHEKILLIINVIPSRETISKYAERKKLIEENISRVNGIYGSLHWVPIIYQYQHLDFTNLVACYTGCDVLLVTPLRDGMNLVAKEFVASRKDLRGALVLSEFAGASIELRDAYMVNPHDVLNVKEAIMAAVSASDNEQQERMQKMQQIIRTADVRHWANSFLDDVRKSRVEEKISQPNMMDADDKNKILKAYKKSRRRLILLDYDGTLVPFHLKPQEAVPGDVIKELVARLAADRKNHVMLISGRDAATLETWFKGTDIDLVAEHGSVYRAAGTAKWTGLPAVSLTWKDDVRKCLEKFVGLHPGSFIEEKNFSLAWHYRSVEAIDDEAVKVSLSQELLLLNLRKAEILQGNKVIEIKSNHTNKGRFVEGVVGNGNYDFVLAVGDDFTDEDMFNVLRESHHYTVKVGLTSTAARFNLVGVNNVLALLDQLGSAKSSSAQLL